MSKYSNAILSDTQIETIVSCSMKDPFELLGMHKEERGISIRTVQHGVVSVKVRNEGKETVIATMNQIDGTGVFTCHFPKRKKFFRYELLLIYSDGSEKLIVDPYSFLPLLSDEDVYLFNKGENNYIYNLMGAHPRTVDEIEGVHFSVWAPSAQSVSVVGSFNEWDGRVHPMRMLGGSGIWEIFIPNIFAGEIYKYEIQKADSGHLVLKADPYGYQQEPFPNHGSIVSSVAKDSWSDDAWMAKRKESNWQKRPMSIYELHLGSWKKSGPDEEGDYLTYQEIAKELVIYIKKMGYTHVELMPIQEHPYVPSWGYQVGGFYAINHRFGTPADFQEFVDYLHQHDIGIILDWVPGHFPKDEHVLAYFDGTHLYEHSDPREGEHKDWGTLIFNYGRLEVKNFLVANALYWIDKFHIDGLRIDAVASMLYRNYSREEGEWVPNQHGGVENLEAIEFLRTVNRVIHNDFPGVVTIAEESTCFAGVTAPIDEGGLGFDFKWNMGWMHDTLDYFEKEAVHRKFHLSDFTYTMWYAFTEKYMLVLSHDEVVHGKKSLLEKMPGDDWQKFANLRMLYTLMMGHPGKKLLFMGGEFGMRSEWYEKREIDWFLLDKAQNGTLHSGLQKLVQDLNGMYKDNSSLWMDDYSLAGFEWVDYNDRDHSVISYIRKDPESDNKLLFVANMTPMIRDNYRLGLKVAGYCEEIFNSNAEIYGGEGTGTFGGAVIEDTPHQGKNHSIQINLPPLGVSVFRIKEE